MCVCLFVVLCCAISGDERGVGGGMPCKSGPRMGQKMSMKIGKFRGDPPYSQCALQSRTSCEGLAHRCVRTWRECENQIPLCPWRSEANLNHPYATNLHNTKQGFTAAIPTPRPGTRTPTAAHPRYAVYRTGSRFAPHYANPHYYCDSGAGESCDYLRCAAELV